MAKEIEYKFICNYIPDGYKFEKQKFSQGYIHIEKEKQVRVRLDWMQRKAWMCIKYMDGNSRDEFEVKMDFQEATELFALCKYKLSKDRYSFNWESYRFDIDKYENGQLIVEIEFRNDCTDTIDDLKERFKFIGDNVDGQYEYSNYYFAGFPKENYK